MRFAGSVSIDTETFQAVMRQGAQSALAAGFKNVFLMGDHGGGQDALRAAAKDLEEAYDKLDKTAHVYYVPDLYFKEKQQMKAYLAEHGIPYDAHAGTDDTSEVMFLDEKKWIRRDKLAVSTAEEQFTTGVDGDPTKATPELGKMFIGWKIDDAVNQIHELLAQKK
jgi:creatinine amidohydrolase/Fe(II)-dependent formamide hydrolase-like protein